jgi:signal transduction histidine kinase
MERFEALLADFEKMEKDVLIDDGNPIILIIDDDDSIRKGLGRVLSHKYRVLVAGSGQEGLEVLSEEVCCVILDVKMKELNGFSTYPKLKAKCPEVPIIFYTAFQSEHDLKEVINRYKPEGYMEKGRDLSFLQDLIEKAVQKFKLILENKEYQLNLEKKVTERTAELVKALTDLESAQKNLVEAEKRAAIFHLVAGVRHEMNTHIQTLLISLQSLKYESLDFMARIMDHSLLMAENLIRRNYSTARESAGAFLIIIEEIKIEYESRGLIEEMRNCLDRTIEAVRILEGIVLQLKEVSDQGEYDLKLEQMETIIEEGLRYLDPTIKKIMPGLKIITDIEKNLPPVLCNKHKIIQALTAQIINSLQAMELKFFPAEEAPTLSICISVNADYVDLRIRDNGIGISQNELANIFNPFYTKKGIGQKGTGLGLSQVAAIVSKHRGRYSAESEQGKYTEIITSFPL